MAALAKPHCLDSGLDSTGPQPGLGTRTSLCPIHCQINPNNPIQSRLLGPKIPTPSPWPRGPGSGFVVADVALTDCMTQIQLLAHCWLQSLPKSGSTLRSSTESGWSPSLCLWRKPQCRDCGRHLALIASISFQLLQVNNFNDFVCNLYEICMESWFLFDFNTFYLFCFENWHRTGLAAKTGLNP